MVRGGGRLAAVLLAAAFGACDGGDRSDREPAARTSPSGTERGPSTGGTKPGADRLEQLGLVRGPSRNLVEACRRVARRTKLSVYCPPVVPRGPVEAPTQRHENAYVFGDRYSYGLSLQSDSLADRDAAKKSNPAFPNFPSRPRGGDSTWNSFAAQHWVVAARRPARLVRKLVDERRQPQFRGTEHQSKPRHFTANGVRATVFTGDIASSGTAGSAHAIVFWQIGGTGYEASVHFDHQAALAVEIARGLIEQMVECAPRAPDRVPETCKWVFPAT